MLEIICDNLHLVMFICSQSRVITRRRRLREELWCAINCRKSLYLYQREFHITKKTKSPIITQSFENKEKQ